MVGTREIGWNEDGRMAIVAARALCRLAIGGGLRLSRP
jgi:hypothetical protein